MGESLCSFSQHFAIVFHEIEKAHKILRTAIGCQARDTIVRIINQLRMSLRGIAKATPGLITLDVACGGWWHIT